MTDRFDLPDASRGNEEVPRSDCGVPRAGLAKDADTMRPSRDGLICADAMLGMVFEG